MIKIIYAVMKSWAWTRQTTHSIPVAKSLSEQARNSEILNQVCLSFLRLRDRPFRSINQENLLILRQRTLIKRRQYLRKDSHIVTKQGQLPFLRKWVLWRCFLISQECPMTTRPSQLSKDEASRNSGDIMLLIRLKCTRNGKKCWPF